MPSLTNLTLCVPRPSSGLDPNVPVLVSSSIRVREVLANHIVIRVDRFGFSANNITYQALGEEAHYRYFDFHPAPSCLEKNVSPKMHGLVPVWGFGTVEVSKVEDVNVGERVYGYFAPARYIVVPVAPATVGKYGFLVPRPNLPADRKPYNLIQRCRTDPQYIPTSEGEDLTMLFRPLYWTAFWCDDWLNASHYRGGATKVVISSASSKTAVSLGYLVRKRFKGKGTVVGLTSKRNVGYVSGLKVFDEVVRYEDVDAMVMEQEERWIYVDVAGNDSVNGKVLEKAREGTGELVAAVNLGATTLAPGASSDEKHRLTPKISLNAPPSGSFPGSQTSVEFEPFFMPEWLAVRRTQLSIPEITSMQNAAWVELMRECPRWVRVERVYGGQEVGKSYKRVVKGRVGPEMALVWSLWDQDRDGDGTEKARL
ncbi:hypothetical protein NEOLEDRAFT_1141377 [Neolentinus lepideus HHB14362 ss-1]|uniref:Uncharacterized protein n=1 Tax=Neolentinus lepideus HHB14362 ss-1 TaxID=1314782 RepID=A0A165NQ20_9AGAM|nr:hypothetical protein NEOLEDRAFT_1141377 [Neolentinus lepideus HHB14362 ss-1]